MSIVKPFQLYLSPNPLNIERYESELLKHHQKTPHFRNVYYSYSGWCPNMVSNDVLYEKLLYISAGAVWGSAEQGGEQEPAAQDPQQDQAPHLHWGAIHALHAGLTEYITRKSAILFSVLPGPIVIKKFHSKKGLGNGLRKCWAAGKSQQDQAPHVNRGAVHALHAGLTVSLYITRIIRHFVFYFPVSVHPKKGLEKGLRSCWAAAKSQQDQAPHLHRGVWESGDLKCVV